MAIRISRIALVAAVLFLSSAGAQIAFAQQFRYKVIPRVLDSSLAGKFTRSQVKPDSIIQVNWSKLSKNMSMTQVDSLLGAPKGTSASLDHAMTFWTYTRGELVFNYISRTLISWDK